MRVIFTGRAEKDWRRLDGSLQTKLLKKLAFYVRTSEPLRFADKLKDSALGEYRFRIGDWRVIFDVHEGDIFVLRVGHRRDIYQ